MKPTKEELFAAIEKYRSISSEVRLYPLGKFDKEIKMEIAKETLDALIKKLYALIDKLNEPN